MPGIFGVIDRDPGSTATASERLQIVRRMGAAMRYEADYVTEIVSSASLGACAGRVGWPPHRTMPPAAAGAPAKALLTTGESDRSATDFHAGFSALNDLEPACAGFFMDQQSAQCVLFNDRYGAERLFIHSDQSRLYFASEAKAILAVVASASAPDFAGVAEWLSCGSTIGGRSLFRGVEVLPGGSVITFTVGRDPVRARYFDDATLERLPALSENQFVEEFTHRLRVAANAAINRSPAAALSLTGGLDSRLVLACLDAAPDTVPCYTFGSMYGQTMDVSVAAAIARECHQPHRTLTLDQAFLDGIDEHFRRAVYASDGYLGLAGSAELYLNRLARQVSPARVTGNWGGELMRGVRAFKYREPKGDFIRSSIRSLLPEVAETFARNSDAHPLTFTLRHQMPHQAFGRYAVERSQVRMRSPFLANDVVKVLYQSSPATRSSMEVVTKVLAPRPGLIAVPTDTGRLGHSGQPVRSLRQSYRRIMVKAEYMTSHGAPDWMTALSARVPFLETAFLGRDKFQHFRYWTRNQLSGFVRNTLRTDDAALADCFDMRRVEAMADDHINGRANYTDELDKVMTMATYRQMILSGSPMEPSMRVPATELSLEMSPSL